MNKTLKDILSITLIAIILGLLLGTVYMVTKAPIAAQEEETKNASYRAVFPEADGFKEADADLAAIRRDIESENLTDDAVEAIVEARSADDTLAGYVITVRASDGYAGDIVFAVGVDESGTVRGISFLELSESPGLGMKAADEGKGAFKEQFTDADARSFSVIRSSEDRSKDDQVQAIAGATITSRAVTNGVNAALIAYRAVTGT